MIILIDLLVVTVNDGNWHLATCVYSSSGKYLKIFKDGVMVRFYMDILVMQNT